MKDVHLLTARHGTDVEILDIYRDKQVAQAEAKRLNSLPGVRYRYAVEKPKIRRSERFFWKVLDTIDWWIFGDAASPVADAR